MTNPENLESDSPHPEELEATAAEQTVDQEAEGAETAGESAESSETEELQRDPLQTAPLEALPSMEEYRPVASLARKKKATEKGDDLWVVRRSHVGAVRERNEDACYTFISQSGGDKPFPAFGLFIVADGMGGHFDGHKASKIASRTVASQVLNRLYLPLLREEEAGPRAPIQEVMEDAVNQANEALYIPDPEKTMGTTLTGALIFGNRLFLVHVGDSRAYLLTEEDGLRPITTDHSVVQALQDAGQLTPEEAAVHPNRNFLYRALMGEELEQIDVFTQSLPAQGTLFLCSDGLWGLISDKDMADILTGPQPLSQKADTLVEKALEGGGHDNITLVLVNFNL